MQFHCSSQGEELEWGCRGSQAAGQRQHGARIHCWVPDTGEAILTQAGAILGAPRWRLTLGVDKSWHDYSSIPGAFVPGRRYAPAMKPEPSIKYLSDVGRLSTRTHTSVSAKLISWQICRLIRRDFNLISKTMYVRCAKPGVRGQYRELLAELRRQADLLSNASSQFMANPDPEVREVPLRLVAPEAATLYRSLVVADEAYSRLNQAAKSGVILVERINAEFAPGFLYTYSMFKAFALQKVKGKPAQQLGSELKIL
jgi:hypothetical protein